MTDNDKQMAEDQIKAHLKMICSRYGVHRYDNLWLVRSDKYAELEVEAAAALKQYLLRSY